MLQEYNPKNENIFIHVNGELLPRKEAKVSVLKACEGMVFEDHQSLIEAAMKKSNV